MRANLNQLLSIGVVCYSGLFLAGLFFGAFAAPTLEARVRALERTVKACCTTSYKEMKTEESLQAYVNLKARVQHLEREVNELKALLEVRK